MKNEITGMKLRLIVMNFLQFAVWGDVADTMNDKGQWHTPNNFR